MDGVETGMMFTVDGWGWHSISVPACRPLVSGHLALMS